LPLALAPVTRLLRSWPGLDGVLAGLPDQVSAQQGCNGLHVALTVVIWLTHSLICYLALTAIAGDLTVVAAAFAGAASNLAFALPVTGVAGLGPPQAAWTAALHLTGVTWEISIESALVVYVCLFVGVILTAAATLLRLPDGARSGRMPLAAASLQTEPVTPAPAGAAIAARQPEGARRAGDRLGSPSARRDRVSPR
jgi:hypothetical protein